MTITSMVFTPMMGTTTFTDPILSYVTILRLCREGLGYNRTDTVGNRSFVHNVAAGSVTFENPFTGDPTSTVTDTEKLFIKFKF